MIVAIQNKLFRNQVMSPLLQRLYDCIKFFIIRGVFPLCIFQLVTEVCNRSVVLNQDCSNHKPTCVTSHLKCSTKIWQNQNWLSSYLLFQQLETSLCFLCPMKIFMYFLDRVHHWCKNSTKISDELPIKTR
jgi:hypothetical protein